jgi:hypothetical protein
MKIINTPISLLLVPLSVLVMLSCNKYKEFTPVPGTKYVVLLVDTDNMTGNAKNYCSFPNQGDDSDEDFETAVFPEDSVIWIGVSTANPFEDRVEIMEVQHVGGGNGILNRQPSGPRGKGGVGARVKPKVSRGTVHRYKIKFRVPNRRPNPITLDPLLRVH